MKNTEKALRPPRSSCTPCFFRAPIDELREGPAQLLGDVVQGYSVGTKRSTHLGVPVTIG